MNTSPVRTFLRPPAWSVCLAAAVACHLVLYAYTTFLHYGTMHFPRELTATEHSGDDFIRYYRGIRDWLDGVDGPPRLTTLAFVAPFLLLEPRHAYALLIPLILAAHFFCMRATAVIAGAPADRAVLGAAAVAPLFAYGMHFELERGQFSLLVTALALAGVWLFHASDRRSRRLAAYALVSWAFQMKVWPAIYFLCLVRDPRAWRENLARAAGLLAANTAVFLTYGWQLSSEFVIHTAKRAANPMHWAGNHSISSFTRWAAEEGYPRASALAAVAGPLLCLAAVAAVAGGLWWRRRPANHPAALAACLMLAVIVPAESQDYKLSTLCGAGGVLLAICASALDREWSWFRAGLLFTATFAYASTFFSYVYKLPHGTIWANNLPALLVLLASLLALLLPGLWRRDPAPGAA